MLSWDKSVHSLNPVIISVDPLNVSLVRDKYRYNLTYGGSILAAGQTDSTLWLPTDSERLQYFVIIELGKRRQLAKGFFLWNK